nr:hypothetical protein [Kiloniella sp. EL199]
MTKVVKDTNKTTLAVAINPAGILQRGDGQITAHIRINGPVCLNLCALEGRVIPGFQGDVISGKNAAVGVSQVIGITVRCTAGALFKVLRENLTEPPPTKVREFSVMSAFGP